MKARSRRAVSGCSGPGCQFESTTEPRQKRLARANRSQLKTTAHSGSTTSYTVFAQHCVFQFKIRRRILIFSSKRFVVATVAAVAAGCAQRVASQPFIARATVHSVYRARTGGKQQKTTAPPLNRNLRYLCKTRRDVKTTHIIQLVTMGINNIVSHMDPFVGRSRTSKRASDCESSTERRHIYITWNNRFSATVIRASSTLWRSRGTAYAQSSKFQCTRK